MATGDIWRLSLMGSTAGGAIITCTTCHVRMKSSGGTFAGAAAYLKTNLLDLLKTYQTSSYSWTGINGQSVNLVPPVIASYTTGFPIAGAVAVQATPPQIALVVKLGTAYAGRSYRGRMYIPGMDESETTGTTFEAVMTNAYKTYYDDLVAAWGSGGSSTDYELVVYSRKLAVANPVTYATVRTIPYTQRRRVLGVGS